LGGLIKALYRKNVLLSRWLPLLKIFFFSSYILSWNVTKFRLHDFGYLDIFWGFPVKCVLLFLLSVKQLKKYILLLIAMSYELHTILQENSDTVIVNNYIISL
jgi:hypothetical protein